VNAFTDANDTEEATDKSKRNDGGIRGDTPGPGHYEGDGQHDATVFRPSNTMWFSPRTTAGTLIQQFGTIGDIRSRLR
jgi:hypothetical protein